MLATCFTIPLVGRHSPLLRLLWDIAEAIAVAVYKALYVKLDSIFHQDYQTSVLITVHYTPIRGYIFTVNGVGC